MNSVFITLGVFSIDNFRADVAVNKETISALEKELKNYEYAIISVEAASRKFAESKRAFSPVAVIRASASAASSPPKRVRHSKKKAWISRLVQGTSPLVRWSRQNYDSSCQF